MIIINPSYNCKYLSSLLYANTHVICQTLSSKYRHDKYVLLGMRLSQHLKTMTIKTIQIQFLTLFVSLYFYPTLTVSCSLTVLTWAIQMHICREMQVNERYVPTSLHSDNNDSSETYT